MNLIKKPNELREKVIIKMCVYGEPGIGKSTLALSSPNPLLFDFDNGIDRVEARYQCDTLPVENYSQVLEVLNSPEAIKKYDTLVFDTLGKCIGRICDYVGSLDLKNKQKDGSITLKAWGQVKLTFQQLIKRIEGFGKNVIFVAHEKVEKIDTPDRSYIKKSLDVSGSAGKDVIKELDLLGYMQKLGQKRVITFDPDESFYAKNSIGLFGQIEVPDNKNKNSFFIDVILKHKQNTNKRNAEERERYNSLIEIITDEIDSLKTVGECNLFLHNIANENKAHIWNSLYIAKDLLNKKIQSLGFSYDTTKKEFIDGK
jgi:hypothetical protein